MRGGGGGGAGVRGCGACEFASSYQAPLYTRDVLAPERNVRNGEERWEADLFTGYQ